MDTLYEKIKQAFVNIHNRFTEVDNKIDSMSGGSSITVDQTYDAESENAQSGIAVAEAINGKVDKIGIVFDVETENVTFDFSDMYNKEMRLHTLSTVSIEFIDNEYAPDYISGLSFDSGETPTGFDYTDSGIINWVGTDCVKNGEISIFQPSPNTHYDIVFYFNGVQFIGLVNGFVPATGNVVSE